MRLRNRLIIILFILSITASIFIFTSVVENRSVDMDYTIFSDSAFVDDHIYYSQNMIDQGLLFDMSQKGDVARIFSSRTVGEDRISAISVKGENIYLVLESYYQKENEQDNTVETGTIYRIVCLDRKFRVQSLTDRFLIAQDEILSGFSAEQNGLFVSMIREDGSYVRVYSINPSVLRPEDQLTGESIKVDSVRSKKCPDENFYVQAQYEYGQLYTRTDKDVPTGIFAVDSNIEHAVSTMRLTMGQLLSLYRTAVIWYIALLLIWLVLLILIIKLLTDRNRIFYLAVVIETVLALITGIGIVTVNRQWQEARQAEHSRFAVISLISLSDSAGLNETANFFVPNFYNSEFYKNLKKHISSFIRTEGNNEIFYDVLITRLSDNMVVASASGRNLQTLTSVYGDNVINLDYAIYRGSKYAAEDIILEGQSYRAVAISEGVGGSNYAMVAIINDSTQDSNVWVDNRGALLLFALFFALGSALVMLILFIQTRDLRQLEQAMADTALGRVIHDRPQVISRDLKEMWSSIFEINKRVEELQYSKLRILEAYYRFAPKNIEKTLSKKSIIEVEKGENIVTDGTVAMMALGEYLSEPDPSKLDRVLAFIGDYQKEHDSIIIGKTPDMSQMALLFLQKEKGCVNFFVQLLNNNIRFRGNRDMDISVVLFYDNCKFGILGNEDEASTYLYFDNKPVVSKISGFIKNKKLGLVITEEVKNRENVTSPLRFIGFMTGGWNGEKVRLYEVLDAYPAVIRKQKIATLKKFQDALAQYYEKDFYLSRTSFSEILKEAPDDLLAKWYVFESDRYLNEVVSGDEYMYLHNN